MNAVVLYPRDVLSPRLVDEHYRSEASAARGAGLRVALVDHDALQAGDVTYALRGVDLDGSRVVYRGWMVSPATYDLFASGLAQRGAELVTSSAAYSRAHELPGWYDLLQGCTAQSVWDAGGSPEVLARLAQSLPPGRGFLKGFTKSLKHDLAASLVEECQDPARVVATASRFLELQDDDYQGGLVLREFEDYLPGEVRTWWVNGECVLSTPHPDTSDVHRSVPLEVLPCLGERIAGSGLVFVTVDWALRSDDSWRVVELGDAQVSDLPASIPGERLVEVLERL